MEEVSLSIAESMSAAIWNDEQVGSDSGRSDGGRVVTGRVQRGLEAVATYPVQSFSPRKETVQVQGRHPQPSRRLLA